MKWSNLTKTKYDDDSIDNFSDNSKLDEEPDLECISINNKFSINRIRSLNYSPVIAFLDENSGVTI